MALKKDSKYDWDQMQTKTFTNWVDQKLRMKGSSIVDISTEFADGIKLHELMTVLSQKDPGKYNKRPRIQVQKMENIQTVLKFIQNEEKIRLVNIGAGDIHDGNLTLIRGLIWMLILHYQIGKGHGLDHAQGGKDGTAKLSGKQLLLQYINSKIPHKNIKNFTTDWNDGTAVAALVDALAPGLCTEADSMDPNDALQNATHAMKLADDWLGVPQVLTPEDMINPAIDELSMMTYLSQFQHAVVKPGAPVQEQATPADSSNAMVVEEEIQVIEEPGLESSPNETAQAGPQLDITKVISSGSLVASANLVIGEEAGVAIDLRDSGTAPLNARVVNTRDNQTTEIELKQSTDTLTVVEGSYLPTIPGEYKLELMFNGEELPDSPFHFKVPEQIDLRKLVEVSGSGITGKGTSVNNEAFIIVDCSKSGVGEVTGFIETPSGAIEKLTFSISSDSATSTSSYIPLSTGLYNVTVEYNGKSVTDQSIAVHFSGDVNKVKVSGSGVTGEGAKVGNPAKIIVDCSDSGVAPITGSVKSPSGKKKDIEFKSTEDPNVFEGAYQPEGAGEHEVAINFDNRSLPKSPFKVPIKDASKVKVSGPGVDGKGVNVGVPAEIIVDCSDSGVAPIADKVTTPLTDIGDHKAEIGGEPVEIELDAGLLAEITVNSGVPLAAKVTTPSGDTKDINFKPKAPGSNVFTGSYTPDDIGDHKVEVDFYGEPVENSPFTANIKNINKVKISGPGVTGDGVAVGKPAKVIVDCSDSGVAPVCAKVKSPSGKVDEVAFVATDDNPNVFEGFYEPEDAGQYELAMEFNDKPLPNSPVIVPIRDILKVKVSGSGITGEGARVGKPANVIVDCSDSGVAPITGSVKSPSGKKEDIKFKPTKDPNVSEGVYQPKDSGEYEVAINFDSHSLPKSPFKVPIKDTSKVKVSGSGIDGKGANVGVPAEIIVDCSESVVAPIAAKVTTPSGDTKDVDFKPKAPGSNVFTGSYTPDDIGDHKVEVDFDGEPVENSPFTANIKNINKVKISGPGVTGDGVVVGKSAKVIVDCSDSGVAPACGKVKSPSGKVDEVAFVATDDNPNVFEGFYEPEDAGQYELAVEFDDKPLPNSPLVVPIRDISKVKVSGSGITGEGARVGKPANVIVDCSDSGVAPISGTIKSPSGKKKDIKFKPTEDPNVFDGAYEPEGSGEHEVAINFDNCSLPKSPFKVPIKDASKVKVSGPGVDGKGANVGVPAEIIVDCSDSGVAPIAAKVTTPSGDTKDVDFKPKAPRLNIFTGSYTPDDIGDHKVEVDFDGKPVESSPFTANIKDINKVKLSGPGVTGNGVAVGKSAKVIVDCSDSGVAPVCAKVKSPSGKVDEVAFVATDDNPNVFEGFYEPEDAGQYELAMEFNDKPLPNSPVIVPIRNISKVKVSGSGITGEGARVGKPANVIVDCSESGVAPVAVKVKDPSGNEEDVHVLPKSGRPNVLEGAYFPKEPGFYEAEVKFDDEPVPDSPYKVGIGKPENVRIGGDGLDKAFVGEDNVIDVFTEGAGPGDISAKFDGPPRAVPVIERVEKVDEDHYQVHYSPQDAGVYNLSIYQNDFSCLDNEPLSFSAVDLNKIYVNGPAIEAKPLISTETYFKVGTTDISNGNGIIQHEDFSISITDASGTQLPHEVQTLDEKAFKVAFTPVASSADHSITISYAGRSLKGSPFSVVTQSPPSPVGPDDRVTPPINDDPLEISFYPSDNAVVNRKEAFAIRLPDDKISLNGNNEAVVSMTGPGDVDIISQVQEDCVCTVTYIASMAGTYQIDVKIHDQDIRYNVQVNEAPSTTEVTPSATAQQLYRNPPNVNHRYSIVPPLHIAALVFLMGLMDKAAFL